MWLAYKQKQGPLSRRVPLMAITVSNILLKKYIVSVVVLQYETECKLGNRLRCKNIFYDDGTLTFYCDLKWYELALHKEIDNREVKQNLLSNVPAADSHPNFFGLSLSYWINLFLIGRATSCVA